MLELDRIYNMDCLDGMKQIDDHSIDLILTDPPYFLPAQHYQTREKSIRNFGDLGILEGFFKILFKEFERVIKKTGTIYIFCDGQSYPFFYFHLYSICKTVRPIIWDKKTSINGYSWRHQHELIIFAEMPNAELIPSGDGDILKVSAVKLDMREHPAEKPVELLRTLIEKSSKENTLVLDPFIGGGSTAVGCKQLNRRFIGFEISPEYYKIAERRISGVKTIQKHVVEG